jgi:hypothetical protein
VTKADHDPGPEKAGDRAEEIAEAASEPVKAADGHEILIGTASWTDPTMTVPGVFYPKGADSAEERLQFYAGRFPLVEVDSTYYALPARRTAELWAERTPPDFTFDVKAHAVMTFQPTETKRLPKDIREALPPELLEKPRISASPMAWNRSARAGNWGRSSSSTHAGGSLRTRTGRRSRTPASGWANTA